VHENLLVLLEPRIKRLPLEPDEAGEAWQRVLGVNPGGGFAFDAADS
jgi:hypothetical protein